MTNTSTRISLDDLPAPMAVGRSAEIYGWDNGRVLKLFFTAIPLKDIEDEYTKTCEAAARGVTGMACHGRIQVDTRWGIILDRVEGISLTRLPEKNPLAFFSLPGTLAGLHLKLHNSRTDAIEDVRALAAGMLETKPLAFLTPEEKSRARAIIDALPDGNAVLHMDFHPENILVTGKEFTLIDWMTAARGTPAADVASTVFLLRDAELFPGISAAKKAFYELVRRVVLSRYLKAYLSGSGLTMAEIDAWRLPVIMLRLGLWDIDSERNRLRTEIQTRIAGPAQ